MKRNYTLLLLLLVALSSFGQTITRIPYLQKGTETGVTIKWRTDVDDTSVVEYTTDVAFTSYSTFSDATLTTEHEVELTGLSSGTVYYYRIGTGGTLLANDTDHYFKTHPSVGSTDLYRFWILGHTGRGDLGNTNAVNVRDQYYNYIGSNFTDGIILNGDNAGFSGTDSENQASVFDMFGDKLRNSILWSCIGNLDGISSNSSTQTGPYYQIFSFPKNGESGGVASGTESYYSFDYGNIHFLILNSFDEDRSVGGSMYNWALNDIQNTLQQWIVAVWHHPPYSKGWHPSEGVDNYGNPAEIELIQMRQNFLPMLENNGVDLVIAGHSESYERSFFINGHYGESATFDAKTHTIGPNGDGSGRVDSDGVYSKSLIGEKAGLGTVYTVLSNSALWVYAPLDHNAMYYSSGYSHGSGILEVENNNLTLKYLNAYGNVEDQFTIHKGPDYVYDNGWQDGNDPNGVSTDLEDLVVVSGDANITTNTTFNTVTVNPDGNLIVDSGVSLTANSIVLESDSDAYSSLNPSSTSTVTGRARYKRYVNQIGTSSGGGNDLISSPVTDGTMEAFSDFADWNKNIAALNNIRAFAPFNNVSGNYENYDIVVNETTPLEAGKGYRGATVDGSPVVFTGAVNVGNVNTTISAGASSSWNLVGNPYTSYIDAQMFISENGSTGNDVLDSNYNAVYGYNSGTDGSGIWTIINNIQNVGKNIAPGQGFFVFSNGTGGTDNLSFTPAMRTTTGNDDFILGRNNSISHLSLRIQSVANNYDTDFYFSDNCSSGLDIGYDAGSLDASDADFSLYSHLVADNVGVDLAIQCLSFEDMESVVVPLGMNASVGDNISINIQESDLSEDINIYLEDNLDNTFTLLNSNTYSFTAIEDLEGTGRFFLHFSPSTLSNDSNTLNGLEIYTITNPDLLNINGMLVGKTQLDLYDVQGRLVLSRVLESGSNTNSINVEALQSGVYIVKLDVSGAIRTEKVIIN